MAQTLKSQFGPVVVGEIAAMLAPHCRTFDAEAFTTDGLSGFEDLELMARAGQLANVMKRHLPADFEAAGAVVLKSLGPILGGSSGHGMAPFFYLPHILFVARYGLGHFDLSMRSQHALTQRFTGADRPGRPLHQGARRPQPQGLQAEAHRACSEPIGAPV